MTDHLCNCRSLLSWVDFDRDGDFDLLTSGLSLQTPIAVKTLIYRNTGGVFADASVGLPGSRKASPKWADFNSDGYIDLAMQWHDGYIPQYWICKGVPPSPTWASLSTASTPELWPGPTGTTMETWI